ncbi:DUF1731 domain-containing protein [Microbacterium sp. NC79]|uniref:DUF1731 domain-containing protein n=1 Tax=Microbacterium sp. NC79 TaxID=2851009 RepID=UPI001C2C10A0|nr:DUF1731 domain-containing protein [Microbacterium sp. NC79]MBV0895235.1 DUF1731 domain-containing protein [Microbacterium sp. NC79]
MPNEFVVIGGASGSIGRALVTSFENDGIRVVRLVRREPAGADEVRWLDGTELDPSVLRGASAVICLNGSSVGSLPWTKKKRSEFRHSRVIPRHLIARALMQLGDDAPHFVHASAAGIYGFDAGVVTEQDPIGTGFTAELADVTEQAAALTTTPTTHARIGVVLHPESVLKPIIPLTLIGLAGRLGSGTQSWPWVSLDDAVAGLRFVAEHRLAGPVNLTGPTRATATDITFAVARELNRPYLVPVPAFALRAVIGAEAANNMLLIDAEVRPQRLLDAGFRFRYESAEEAIHDSLAPLRLDA